MQQYDISTDIWKENKLLSQFEMITKFKITFIQLLYK